MIFEVMFEFGQFRFSITLSILPFKYSLKVEMAEFCLPAPKTASIDIIELAGETNFPGY